MKYNKIRRQGIPQENRSSQTLYLAIETSESWDFYQKFDMLGPIQQKIWRKLCEYNRAYPNAFPSQSRISKECKCGRKHVNRTVALFKEYGWISLTSRGVRRSKSFSIPQSLIQTDVFKREYFKRTEVTSKVTHNYSKYKNTTSRGTGGLPNEVFKPILIPPDLQKLKHLPLEAKLKLAMVPEHIRQEALYSSRLQAKKGKVFTNEIGYVVGTAINMAKDRNIPLPWKEFYRSVKFYQKAA